MSDEMAQLATFGLKKGDRVQVVFDRGTEMGTLVSDYVGGSFLAVVMLDDGRFTRVIPTRLRIVNVVDVLARLGKTPPAGRGPTP